MKTTLEIPDPTFRKAKATASGLGIPLREYVTQAVSRVSDVVNKKTAKFTIDTLVEMLSRLGKPVRLVIT